MQFIRSCLTFAENIRRLTDIKMDPLQEFVTVVRESGAAGTSYKPYKLRRFDKPMLRFILLSDPFLLFSKYEGCDTVWRWLIKHDYFLIIKLILNESFGGEFGIRWFIPSNQYDENDGSTIFTDHSLCLSARLFHLLFTDSGEKLDLHNKETNETVLHMLLKQNTTQGKETALEILKSTVAENSMDLDPNMIDFAGRTALHYALERGNLRAAELLVERIGADWDLAMVSVPPVSNETLASRHPECVKFLQKCEENYSIKPNSEGHGETCAICLDEIEDFAYLMRCCKKKLHTVCLRKYLARAKTPSCAICRRNICKSEDKDLYDRIPSTVFKSKWEEERAQRLAEAAADYSSSSNSSSRNNIRRVFRTFTFQREYRISTKPFRSILQRLTLRRSTR